MKVKFTDKKLWNDYSKTLMGFATFLSLLLTIFNFQICSKIIIVILLLIILIAVFIRKYRKANNMNELFLNINHTKVHIKYGDIFEQEGIKVIAFNEYFDTKVDNKIILESSLNGNYINNHSSGFSVLDNIINAEMSLNEKIVKKNVKRKYGGKTTKYKLGTLCPIDDYYAMAFSHMDDYYRAYLSVEDYVSCLMHMWNQLDIYYSSKTINIPLFGAGITRFNDTNISSQELLEYIITTYKASKVKFNNVNLTIVLNKDIKNEINLYKIKEEY